jgi:hypothetical protein
MDKKTTPKYTYPKGYRPWMIEPFPIGLRTQFVALAKEKGKTTPVLLEEVLRKYMETE